MAWLPFDLVSLAASSKAALTAERAQFVSTLEALRAGLARAVSSDPSSEGGRRMFANAASDLFCQCRLLAAGMSNTYPDLELLATHVERVLASLKRGSLTQQEADDLAGVLGAEIGRFR